jgi:PKD repeat protein
MKNTSVLVLTFVLLFAIMGCEKDEIVTPANTNPLARFTITPTDGNTDTTFTFDASESSDNESNFDELRFRWRWTAGEYWDTEFSSSPVMLYRFPESGRYAITLEVKDPDGGSGFFNRNISVDYANTPPSAAFTMSADTTIIGGIIEFNPSSSYDNHDRLDSLRFRWDWESDGQWDTEYSNELLASHSYDSLGIYEITLQVMDTKNATARVSHEIIILHPNQPPVPQFSITPQEGNVRTVFEFDASMTTDDEDDAANLLFRWDWESDGEWDTAQLASPFASHLFSDPGAYSITLEVWDSRAATGQLSVDVTVLDYLLPETPTNLELVIGGIDRIALSWEDNSGNEDGFIVERRTQDLEWAEINRTGADQSTFTDAGLDGDVFYFYRVCAFNQEGCSKYSNVVSDIIDRELVTIGYDNGNLINFLTLPESNGMNDKYYNVKFTPPAAPYRVNSVHIGLFDLFGGMGTPGMRVYVWQSGEQNGEGGYPMDILDSLDIPFEDLVFGNEEPVFNLIDLTPLEIYYHGMTDFHIGVGIITDSETDTLAVYVDDGESPSTRSGFYSVDDERWYKMDDPDAYDTPYNFAIRAAVEIIGEEGELVVLDYSRNQPSHVTRQSRNPGKKEATINSSEGRAVRSVFKR